MIRPITLRLFGIVFATLGALGTASASASAVESEVGPPAKSHVLDPSTFALIGLGLVGLAVFRRRTQGPDKG